MKTKNSNRFSIVTQWALVLAVLVVPQVTQAKTWQATAGARVMTWADRLWHFYPTRSGFTRAMKSPGDSQPRR